jgi:protease-4
MTNDATPTASPPPLARDRRPVPWLAWVLLAVLLGSVLVNLVLFAALLFGVSTPSPMREALVDGEPGAPDKILLIATHGILLESSSGWGGGANPVTSTIQALDYAERDKAVKGIVLHIQSPGGGISDCDRILHRIQRFRKARPQVPLVASLGDVAASGGYYVAAAADWIVAQPSTITGSIGVIMQLPNVEKLAQSVGFRMEVVKSAERKDIGSPFRSLTDAERAHFQGLIDEMYEQFLSVVLEGRRGKILSRDALLPLADGNVTLARKAVATRLVDAIGYRDDAFEEARRRAKAPGAKVIRYERTPGFLDLLGLRVAPASSPDLDAVARLARHVGDGTARMMYLWAPGRE